MLWAFQGARIFVCTRPADMRRSFDGLCALARDWAGQDPLSGHLFVFCNRKADRVKVLWWDRSGLALWYKRLEEGTFRFPDRDGTAYEMDVSELALVLEGIELAGALQRTRYKLPS